MQRVVIVLLGEPDTSHINVNMQNYIKTKSYIDSQDPWFWKKLRYQLDKKTSKRKTEFSNLNQDPVTPIEERDGSYKRPISSEFLISAPKKKKWIFWIFNLVTVSRTNIAAQYSDTYCCCRKHILFLFSYHTLMLLIW